MSLIRLTGLAILLKPKCEGDRGFFSWLNSIMRPVVVHHGEKDKGEKERKRSLEFDSSG